MIHLDLNHDKQETSALERFIGQKPIKNLWHTWLQDEEMSAWWRFNVFPRLQCALPAEYTKLMTMTAAAAAAAATTTTTTTRSTHNHNHHNCTHNSTTTNLATAQDHFDRPSCAKYMRRCYYASPLGHIQGLLDRRRSLWVSEVVFFQR